LDWLTERGPRSVTVMEFERGVPPHPNPLPRGEGTARPALGTSGATYVQRLGRVTPLPRGEGWGEGKWCRRTGRLLSNAGNLPDLNFTATSRFATARRQASAIGTESDGVDPVADGRRGIAAADGSFESPGRSQIPEHG